MGKNVDNDLEILFQVDMPERYYPLKRFVCRVYSAKSNLATLPQLRRELFQHKNLKGEKLFPTRGTLLPHILCTNYISMKDKSYVMAKPVLPALEINVWDLGSERVYRPTMCLIDPGPKAVLELVKCGCHGSCVITSCACLRNGLFCMDICKCTDCSNVAKFHIKDIQDTDL